MSTLRQCAIRGALWLAAMSLPATASAAAHIEVAEVRWGFDGRVVPERFNVLTVRIVNPTSEPFDGAMRLVKSHGGQERAGAPYSEPCYLAPHGARWIQFYPFIGDRHDSWRLEWGRRLADRYDLPRPALAAPARVLLVADDATTLAHSAFRAFPAGLFPPTAAGTMALDSVILDHIPRWESARREAFLDWLRGGGTVHLLRDEQDRELNWTAELSVLNAAVEDAAPVHVGAGTVVRHARTRRTLPPAALEAAYPEPRLDRSEQAFFYDPSGSILRSLTRAVRVRYRWWLINVLALGYVVAIGPGVHLLSRRWRDYRLTWLAMAALIAVSASLFHLAGRRGRGETSAVFSLSVARDLGAGRFLVTQWVDAFAARGAQYRLTHGAPWNLYATTSENEPVDGVLESGRDGAFTVDIPVSSHRPFMHQAVLAAPQAGLTVGEATSVDGELAGLSVRLSPGLARDIIAGVAVFNDRVFPMKRRGESLVLGSDSTLDRCGLPLDAAGTPAGEVFSRQNVQQALLGYGAFGRVDRGTDPAPESLLKRLLPGLLLWSLESVDGMPYRISTAPERDRVRLFALASTPEALWPTGMAWGRRIGLTLYRFDVPVSAAAGVERDSDVAPPSA